MPKGRKGREASVSARGPGACRSRSATCPRPDGISISLPMRRRARRSPRSPGLPRLPRLEASFDVTRRGRGGLHVVGRVSATVGPDLRGDARAGRERGRRSRSTSSSCPPRAVAPDDDGARGRGDARGCAGAAGRRGDRPRRDCDRIPDSWRSIPIRASRMRCSRRPPAGDEPAHPFAALAALKKGQGGEAGVMYSAPCCVSHRHGMVAPCPKKSASRSTPWGVTMGQRSWFRAPNCRSPVIPTSNFCCSATAPSRAAARCAPAAQGGLARSSTPTSSVQMDDKPSQALRKGRRKSSMWLAIDAVKKGEADVAVSAGNTGALMAMAKIRPADHGRDRAAGDRGDLADAAGRLDRARPRRLDRRRCRASGRSRGHGQRHGARAVRSRAADGRPAQYRRRGGQGARGGARGRPHPARGQLAAIRVSSASSRATTSARARSTWW